MSLSKIEIKYFIFVRGKSRSIGSQKTLQGGSKFPASLYLPIFLSSSRLCVYFSSPGPLYPSMMENNAYDSWFIGPGLFIESVA